MTVELRWPKIAAVAAASVLLVVAFAQQAPPPTEAVLDDSDGDLAIDLAEEITGSDPYDRYSFPESTGTQYLSLVPVCSDGVDNDLDGLTDDDDDGCVDSDDDHLSDATEAFLGSDQTDSSSVPEDSRLDLVVAYLRGPISLCTDGLDNDGDTLVDGDDPGCTPSGNDGDAFGDLLEKQFGSDPNDAASVPEHELVNPGSCSDGVDNDLDGLTDADDPACGPPANDDRANATMIQALPFIDGPTIVKNATVETDEPEASCVYGDMGLSLWYRFAATADAVLIADAAGEGLSIGLAVWTEDGSGLTQVACVGAARESRMVFQASGGQTYIIQVVGFSPDDPRSSLTFSLRAGTRPANDDLADATAITSLPFTDSLDTSAALTEPGEPYSSCGGGSGVWYRFTPTQDTLVVADTAGSDYALVVAVWLETASDLEEIGCVHSWSEGETRLPFLAGAGQSYVLGVTGFGNLIFSLEVGIPPANDDIADVTEIPNLPFSESLDTVSATREPGEPACGPHRLASTIWYKFTPASDTFLMVDDTGTDFRDIFAVYEGTSLSDLRPVACARPSYYGGESRVVVEATAGQTYFFQVGGLFHEDTIYGGYPPSYGNATFNVRALAVPSCPDIEFSVSDPTGDTFGSDSGGGVSAPDIVSVSGGSDEDTFCLTVQFAGPIAPALAAVQYSLGKEWLGGHVDFDIDQNPHTGIQSKWLDWACPNPPSLGVDASLQMRGGTGLLMPISRYSAEESDLFAIAHFDQTSFTLVVPLAALGGDDAFNFAMAFGTGSDETDCAPDGSVINSPVPAAIGDGNCDGAVATTDATVILQLSAGVVDSLPCQHVADVNGDGTVSALDAALILQYDAGLLEHL